MTGKTLAQSNHITTIARPFLNKTLKEVMALLRAERGSLFLFDHNNQDLVLDTLYPFNPNLMGIRQGIGEGIAGKVADSRTPVLVENIDSDGRFSPNGQRQYHSNSFISIPLISSDSLMGVMNVSDKSNGKPFDEKDLNFSVFICRYACMAVDSYKNCSELKLEKESFDKQKLLLEKYASVGKLAAGIVHEINNPLDGIIRYTNILLEQIKQDSSQREYLLEVKKGLNRIANITKSLLEFSHQVNLNTSQIRKYIHLHELIEETLGFLSEKFNGNIALEKIFDERIARVLDFGLSFVIVNIIKNALDAMPHGGLLAITTKIEDSILKVSFKDTGSGIPDEIKSHIFEPFFSTKSIDKGTGLGLAISSEIISKYNGRIDVENNPIEGTTFSIIIPDRYLENA